MRAAQVPMPISYRTPESFGLFQGFSSGVACFVSRNRTCIVSNNCSTARMSNVTVCVRFRPLSHKERKANGDNVCFKRLDSESFVLKVWTLSILLLP